MLPIHGCISINRQLTSPTENNFAGKRSMECTQNKDLVRNKIQHQKTYKIGKLVRKRIKHRLEGKTEKSHTPKGTISGLQRGSAYGVRSFISSDFCFARIQYPTVTSARSCNKVGHLF